MAESKDALLFESLGVNKSKAKEAAKNAKLCVMLKEVIGGAGAKAGCDSKVGILLYEVAAKLKKKKISDLKNFSEILKYITNGKIKSSTQASEAVKQLINGPAVFDVKSFESACGVGVEVSKEEVDEIVKGVFASNNELLMAKRYQAMGIMMGKVRSHSTLRWANSLWVKESFDKCLKDTLGERTEEDKKMRKGKKQGKGKKDEKKSDTKEEDAGTDVTKLSAEQIKTLLRGREIPWAKNDTKIDMEHRKRTKGLIRTRFPPEPNGYLHIGHAKAMNFNFGVAKKFGGVTYLRFDDTNPEAEKKEYITNIIENVKFMGHEPWKITYSSDEFNKLYEFAIKLIKKEKAYVCHMTGEEITENKKLKQKQKPSPWRNRPIAESLFEFERMRKGYYAEGEATLRLKMDITHDNPNLWDIVGYRVIYKAHPHAGDRWCIYPTYDFTHCIIDSLEDITHSLCTMEFETRRESYYWLLDELEIFKPNVWEYGRLNIKNNVLSKRKLKYLVMSKTVRGWDDPRLLTINGLRRRGYTAEGINSFCEAMGVSRAMVAWASYERLELCGRQALTKISPRRMVVTDPLKMVIKNMDEKACVSVKCQDFPDSLGIKTNKKFTVPLSKVCYIERKDFKPSANSNFFGMTVGKTVRLLHAFNVTCTGFDKDSKGEPSTVYCTIDLDNKTRVKKGFLHWVSSPPGKSPVKVTVNIYDKLFLVERPGEGDVDYLTQLNPNSLKVMNEAIAFAEMGEVKTGEHYQFERLGYFYVDPDTKPGKPVFNRTMALGASKKKG